MYICISSKNSEEYASIVCVDLISAICRRIVFNANILRILYPRRGYRLRQQCAPKFSMCGNEGKFTPAAASRSFTPATNNLHNCAAARCNCVFCCATSLASVASENFSSIARIMVAIIAVLTTSRYRWWLIAGVLPRLVPVIMKVT